MRCFIDIDIPQEVKDQLSALQEELKQEFKGRFEKQKNMHLTLKFLGEVDDVEEVKEQLEKIAFKPFTIHISQVGHFRNRYVWVDARGAEELKEAIDKAIPAFKDDYEVFNPHINLVRMGHTTRTQEKLEQFSINTSFECSSFNLKKSTLTAKGAIHEIIETFQAK